MQHIRLLLHCKDEEDEDNHDEAIKNNSTMTLKVITKMAMIMNFTMKTITAITTATKIMMTNEIMTEIDEATIARR